MHLNFKVHEKYEWLSIHWNIKQSLLFSIQLSEGSYKTTSKIKKLAPSKLFQLFYLIVSHKQLVNVLDSYCAITNHHIYYDET